MAEKIVDRTNPFVPPAWVGEGWPAEVTPVVEQLYKDANKEFGTNLSP
jgi:hypothetical protein